MSTKTETKPAEKPKAAPAVKVAPDVHQAISLRKVRSGGKIESLVDEALRIAFAEELAQLEG